MGIFLLSPQIPRTWNLGRAGEGRFRNDDVLKNLSMVVGKIKELISK
jgi:hypothetical protein